MDKIQGPQFGNYDGRHLEVSRRMAPESVKPNVFKEIDEEVAKALLLTDLVSLSPEAREILKKIRKSLEENKGKRAFIEGKEEDFNDLLYGLKKLKESVYDEEEGEEKRDRRKREERKTKEDKPRIEKLIIPLSGPKRPEIHDNSGGRQRPRQFSDNGGEAGALAESMVVRDASSLHKSYVGRELGTLGEKMVSYVKSFGVHIIVLERGVDLTQKRIKGMMIVAPGEKSFDGRRWEDVRGIYCQDRRLIVIGEELLGVSHHSAMRHEFAHAFDHAFTSRNNRKLPLSVQLWNWFSKERRALPSRYAATNPAEYFAESVDAFFITEGRAYLQQNDPQMYDYLATLFSS